MLGIKLIFSPPLPLVPLFSSPPGPQHQNHLGTLLICPHITLLSIHPTQPLIYTLTESTLGTRLCWALGHSPRLSLFPGRDLQDHPGPEVVRKPVPNQAVPHLQEIQCGPGQVSCLVLLCSLRGLFTPASPLPSLAVMPTGDVNLKNADAHHPQPCCSLLYSYRPWL